MPERVGSILEPNISSGVAIMSIRHSRPQARRGEALLVVILIFFVLLSLFLLAVVWFLYQDQEDNRARTQEAESTVRALDEDCNWYKFQALMLREYIGPQLQQQEDRVKLRELRERFDVMRVKPDALGFGSDHKYAWMGKCDNPDCPNHDKKFVIVEPVKGVVA